MTSPAPTPQTTGEQISYADILNAYQEKVSELTHELMLAGCRIKNRDETIERLLAELDRQHELPDIPHH